MVGTCRDASNLKGGLNFPREIPRSLNFAPRFDPSFFPRFEETPAFSKPRRISLVHQKKGKEREKFAAGCFFFSFLIVVLYRYMYICVCMYFIFTANFPIFACISIFERGRARTRVHALFVRSMRSITMRTKEYRRVESKIMQKLYNSMFPLFLLILFFILFLFRSRGHQCHLRRPTKSN